MSPARFLFVFLVALLPLTMFRELWWSNILFGKPWKNAGGAEMDWGPLNWMLDVPFVLLLSLLGNLALALIMDTLIGILRQSALPVFGLASIASAVGIVLIKPDLSWAGLWPMLGFTLVSVIWIYAALQSGRKG